MNSIDDAYMGHSMRLGYRQTEVGLIPDDWVCTNVGAVFCNGIIEKPMDGNHGNIHPKKRDFVDYGIPFVMANDVQNGTVDLDGCAFIRKEQAESLMKGFAREGDVLLTHKATMGNTAVVGALTLPYIMLTPQVTYYRVRDTNRLSNQYLRHFFDSDAFQRRLIELSGGGTRAYLGIVGQHKLPLALPPTLVEQEAIASALGDADALIESLEQFLAKKRLIKQGAMQELLTGDWPRKAFGDLFKFSGGYSASRDDLGSDGHLYLHYGDIHGSVRTFIDVEADSGEIPRIDIPLSEVSPASLLEHGDVVFVDASEDVDGTNKHVVIDNPEGEPFISGLHTIVAKRKTNDIDPRYMRYCFQTPEIKEQFRFYAVGTKVSGVSKTSIAKIALSLPSPDEQAEFAATLDAMEQEIELIVERVAKARQLKQAMMQQLLTGKIRLVGAATNG